MKFALIDDGGALVSAAVCEELDHWVLLKNSTGTEASIEDLIRFSRHDQACGWSVSDQRIPPTCRFLAPSSSPQKIICVGKNYAAHAGEMGGAVPEIPVIFNKLPSCLIGHEASIELPAISNQVDYEAELVVVIGLGGRNIERDNAMQHVWGYTIGNDVTARDWQKGRPGGQWFLGKSFDTFAPLGPWIVTADEIPDPHNLTIELKLNGATMQQGNTSDLIFRIDVLIEHISKFFYLQPGDLLFTGTPAGVGDARQPPVYLNDGDNIEISIQRIGTLTNDVVAVAPAI